jgi:hypothetical protein
MPARMAQQDNENGMMEAACLQAVSASLANPDGVRAPRLHPRYFLKSNVSSPRYAGRGSSWRSFFPINS